MPPDVWAAFLCIAPSVFAGQIVGSDYGRAIQHVFQLL